MRRTLGRLGLLTLVIVTLHGATGFCGEADDWSDQAELSFVDAGGNTEVRALSASNTFVYGFSEDLIETWKVSVLSGETEGIKTAERYSTTSRLEYKFTERFSSFGRVGWLQDKFSGIDSRYSVGASAGYQVLTGPENFFGTEAGLSYAEEKYIDDTDKDFLGARFFVLYEYAFSGKDKVSQSVEYLHDFDESENYNLNSETAMISSMNDSLSLKVSYLLSYDNKPVPASLEKTDSLMSVALVLNL